MTSPATILATRAYDHLLSAYRSQIAIMAQTKPKGVRAKGRPAQAACVSECGCCWCDAQWKVAPLAAAKLRSTGGGGAEEAPQQAAFVPVGSDKRCKPCWPRRYPSSRRTGRRHRLCRRPHGSGRCALEAVVDQAVRDIKAHWAAAEAPPPEAAPAASSLRKRP